MTIITRLKQVLVDRLLGLDDSPHRIAAGVLVGCMVAMTPTLGLQVVIYLAVAPLLRVNKVSGVPFLFIMNPLTAAPLLGFSWWLGQQLIRGGVGESNWDDVYTQLMAVGSVGHGSLSLQVLTLEFWRRVWGVLSPLGAELWVGSLISGFGLGLPAYAVVRFCVGVYRTRAGDGGP